MLPLPPTSRNSGASRNAGRRAGHKLVKSILKAMREHNFEEPVFWCCSPSDIHILEKAPHGAVVYDAAYSQWPSAVFDHMPQAPDRLPPWMVQAEKELCLLLRTDASEEQSERLAPLGKPVHLLPGGAHFTMFNTAIAEDLPFPDELFKVKNPIIGYVGAIDANVDLTYIEAAAKIFAVER